MEHHPSQVLVHPFTPGGNAPSLENNITTNARTQVITLECYRASGVKRLSNLLLSAICSIFVWGFKIALLGLPIYLRAQSFAVGEDAKRCKGAYDGWNENRETTSDNNDVAGVEANGSRRTIDLYSFVMPDSVVVFMRSWSAYVECRAAEWVFCFLPISIAFIGSAPSIFQFPGAIDDPVTRAFTALATFRAISAILYTVFSHVYVRDRVKDTDFAIKQVYSGMVGRSTSWRIWIMLSFPAAATGWAAVLYMCAVASFVLRVGIGAASPTTSNSIHLPLAVMILTGAAVDCLCMVWVCVSLRGYKGFKLEEKTTGL